MNRKELGKLIAALRSEQFDEEGNRLTQAGLAERALDIDPASPLNNVILGKIERGERANLDGETLLSLADALQLTVGERKEFFLIATGVYEEELYAGRRTAQEFQATAIEMLRDIQLPALLVDSYLDVIAVNGLLMELYAMRPQNLQSRAQQAAGINLLGYIFSADFAPQRDQMTQHEWHNFAVGNVIYFRRVTLRNRTTDYFSALLAQLRRSREFRWYWEQVFYEERRYFVGGESFNLGTGEPNDLNYLTAPLVTLTPFGNLEIIVHIPRNRSTAATFEQIAATGPPRSQQLSTWPEKVVPSP